MRQRDPATELKPISEFKLPSSRERNRRQYTENKAASLSAVGLVLPPTTYGAQTCPEMTLAELKKMLDSERKEAVSILCNYKGNYEELLNIFSSYIHEHYLRRVDLFFYLLVAYYQTGLVVKIANPTLQHGIGKANITEAAHSSLFTQLQDDSIYNDEFYKRTSRSKTLYNKQSIICGTKFMCSLNSTVEVPTFVNDLDQELEGKDISRPSDCRRSALTILQDVSNGKLNPIEGVTEFLKVMKITFHKLKERLPINNHNETEPYLDRDTATAPKAIKFQLLALAEKATLQIIWLEEKRQVNEEYVQCLLGLTKDRMRANPNKTEIYKKRIMELQYEILNSPSDQVKIIDTPDQPGFYDMPREAKMIVESSDFQIGSGASFR